MKKQYELIIFDLDGTLLDTSEGIFNSVRYAEKCMGFEPISDVRLREFVGPPPKSMYMQVYGANEEDAVLATQKHREYGKTKAIYEAKVYSGMEKTLQILKSQGYKLAVATLKSQKIAEVVLENFKLAKYFDVIIGMNESENLTKCMTIQMAIEQTQTTGWTLMVGDSQYDYDGAKEAEVDFVGALYGFGFDGSYEGRFATIKNPSELLLIV